MQCVISILIWKNYIEIQVKCNQTYQEVLPWQGQKLGEWGRHEDGTECLCYNIDLFFHYLNNLGKDMLTRK